MPKQVLSKKKRKALRDAMDALQHAVDQAHGAEYYFDNDADIKGYNWTYAACTWAEKSAKLLKSIMPKDTEYP